MAKQIGCGIKGKIDGYSFYHDRMHGYLVRRTGGVPSKIYKTDQRYAATRDASSEFATVSKAGKLIRDAFAPFISPIKDGTMVNRLNKELISLKQQDLVHSRGNRRSETMMTDVNANKWLRIFQFNEGVTIYDLFDSEHSIKTSCAPVIHANREDARDHVTALKLKKSGFPEGATHAGLTLIRSVIDFEEGSFETDSSQMVLISKSRPDTIYRVPTLNCAPTFSGIEIVCLQVVFYQKVNGELIQLNEKVHSMGVIELRRVEKNSSQSEVFWTKACNQVTTLPIYVEKNELFSILKQKKHPVNFQQLRRKNLRKALAKSIYLRKTTFSFSVFIRLYKRNEVPTFVPTLFARSQKTDSGKPFVKETGALSDRYWMTLKKLNTTGEF